MAIKGVGISVTQGRGYDLHKAQKTISTWQLL